MISKGVYGGDVCIRRKFGGGGGGEDVLKEIRAFFFWKGGGGESYAIKIESYVTVTIKLSSCKMIRLYGTDCSDLLIYGNT